MIIKIIINIIIKILINVIINIIIEIIIEIINIIINVVISIIINKMINNISTIVLKRFCAPPKRHSSKQLARQGNKKRVQSKEHRNNAT